MVDISQDMVEEVTELETELFPDNNMNALSISSELCIGFGFMARVEGIEGNAGYVLARPVDGMVDVLRLGIRETFRGRGLGRLLLERATEGFDRSMLTVRKDNAPAMTLYRSVGFVIAGELDANWVMVRASASCT